MSDGDRDREPGRLRRERRTIHAMIRIYCRGRHGARADLCSECAELGRYADARLDRCPMAPEKPTCVECTIHCYRPAMRERIREVMRYAGPRMVLRHPVLALLHTLDAGRRGVKRP